MNCIHSKKQLEAQSGPNTHIHPDRRMHFRTSPAFPPHVLDLMRTERAHFYPQHWLLCHMGLY